MALDPSAGARAAIAAWRDGLVAGRDDLRSVAEGSLHVTLAFLGYLPERRIPDVAAAVEAACSGQRAAALRPAGLRAVPPRSPRLFALDLDDPAGGCAAIQSAVVAALAGAGLHTPERRAFWPHITLARVKRGERALSPAPPGALPPAFSASEVVVYRSTLRPQGALYEPLARVELPAA